MNRPTDVRRSGLGWIAALWGLGGTSALLVGAILRVGKRGLEAFSFDLGPHHWLAIVVWIVFMAWSEGYRGFHRSYAPRVASRARYLRAHPEPLHVLLAPLFCLGFVHATKARKIRSTVLAVGILGIILFVRAFVPQPWRGIVNLGVIVGLSMGVLSIWFYAAQALSQERFDYPNDTPPRNG